MKNLRKAAKQLATGKFELKKKILSFVNISYAAFNVSHLIPPHTIYQCSPYDGKWSKTMVGFGPEDDHFVAELTYNYGVGDYQLGNDFLVGESSFPI